MHQLNNNGMKIRSVILAIVSVVMLSSCSSLGKVASSTDYQNGSTAGSVIANLFSQFKSGGTVDFSKAQNILNAASLVSSLKSLTSGSNAAVKDFSQGIVTTSQNLVNKDNVQKVVGTLQSLGNLNLDGITRNLQSGKAPSAETSSFQNTITTLLGSLAK